MKNLSTFWETSKKKPKNVGRKNFLDNTFEKNRKVDNNQKTEMIEK